MLNIPILKPYFNILKLTSSATLQEIQHQYKKLAIKMHPDKHNNDQAATQAFQELQQAFEILKKAYEDEAQATAFTCNAYPDDDGFTTSDNTKDGEDDLFGFFASKPKLFKKTVHAAWQVVYNSHSIIISHPKLASCCSEITFWHINTNKAELTLPLNNNYAFKQSLKRQILSALYPYSTVITSDSDLVEISIKLPRCQTGLSKLLNVLASAYELPRSVITLLYQQFGFDEYHQNNVRNELNFYSI